MIEFNEIIFWLEENPQWIAIGIIGASFIESFALVGIIVPGVVLLAIISGLASASLSIYEVVLIAYFSSLLSDVASFFIGLSLKKSIHKIWPFTKYPDLLNQGKSFFKKYGILGLFIGKFIGPVRPLLPITAGTLDMEIRKFFLIEIFSCFIWALVYTIPGYYAAQTMVSEINPFNSFSFWISLVVLFVLIRYFSKKYKML